MQTITFKVSDAEAGLILALAKQERPKRHSHIFASPLRLFAANGIPWFSSCSIHPPDRSERRSLPFHG